MHRLLLSTILFTVTAAASPPGAPTLDEILACNDRAVGGAEAWSRVGNLRIGLQTREPGFEVEGTYVATRQGEMRIDIFADGQRVFAEGLHQGRAWEWTPQSGRREADDQAAAALRHGIEMPGRFFTLQQVRARGTTVEQIASEEAAAAGQWQLRVTLADGFSSDLFLDRNSCQVQRSRDRRAFHPGVDPTETVVETTYDGELVVDGVLRHPNSENRDVTADAWLGTTEVRSIEHNIELPEDFFSGRQ